MISIKNKSPYFSLLMLFLFPAISWAQTPVTGADSARVVIDSMLNFAKSKSLYRNRVDWQLVTDSVHHQLQGTHSIKEAMPAAQLLYRLLGDYHGFVIYRKKYYKWWTKNTAPDTIVHRNLIRKMKSKSQVETQVLNGRYGYILVPANNPTHRGDNDRLSQELSDSLTNLHPASLKGLIIDLRTNGGGDMYPMILGLSGVLGEGKLGAFADPVTGLTEEWGISGNFAYDGKDTVCRLNVAVKKFPKLKVVVLLSPNTASSGEATAISFRGRKNTRFIGEDSAGFTTANQSFSLFGLNIFMASSVESDRNGKAYLDRVSPDQEVKGLDNFDELQKDGKVIAALKWLR